MLKEGDPAPAFQLPADDGREISLTDLRGKHVVLYFYPKASTPGCTTEAIEFRELKNGIRQTQHRHSWLQRGFGGIAGKIQGQAEAEFPAAQRSGLHRDRSVRRAPHEKFSGKIFPGHCAQHGPDRPRRQGGENLGDGQIQGPRRRGGGSVEVASVKVAQASQNAEKLTILSFRAKRGISLSWVSIKERFLASLGMTI